VLRSAIDGGRAAMTLLKVAAGLLSGSLGVLSDAAHSGLDLVGAALTYFSVHVSDRPADEDHTYGHGKIENLSAFSEAGLMALSCAWIIWEAVQRIFYQTVELHHSLWPMLVLVTSIAVDIWRSRQLRAVAVHRDRRRWRRMPSTLLRTFGPRWRCWRAWALRGWESDFKLARCIMPIHWQRWWCR
jgi:cation diffusion facilitator family transporter